jgi:hypothetical protein
MQMRQFQVPKCSHYCPMWTCPWAYIYIWQLLILPLLKWMVCKFIIALTIHKNPLKLSVKSRDNRPSNAYQGMKFYKTKAQTIFSTNIGGKLSFIPYFLFPQGLPCCYIYVFTDRTCKTTIVTLEPCALNAEFQYFILKFNKISLLCRYHLTTLLSNLFLYWTCGFPLSQLSWVHSLSTILKFIHFPMLPYKSCVPCFQAQSLLHLPTLIPCITLIRSTIVLLSKRRKFVCFVVMRSTELGCFRSCCWCLWKALNEEGCMGLVPWCLDLRCKSSWILNDFFTKIKLNHGWKFQRNWNVPLVLVEKSWWAGFNRIYLIRFGFRMWDILIFKWFLLLKIQINSKKPGFGRKN